MAGVGRVLIVRVHAIFQNSPFWLGEGRLTMQQLGQLGWSRGARVFMTPALVR